MTDDELTDEEEKDDSNEMEDLFTKNMNNLDELSKSNSSQSRSYSEIKLPTVSKLGGGDSKLINSNDIMSNVKKHFLNRAKSLRKNREVTQE